MNLAGLEISGFAEYIEVSESHIYAILNGNRELTSDIADKIARGFNIDGSDLLRSGANFTKANIDKKKLENFYSENKGVSDYFASTKAERKVALYIESHVLSSGLFSAPVTVAQVRKYCIENGKALPSKRISQILKYLVAQKKLKRAKKPMQLKSGKLGNRLIDYYYL